MQFISTMKNGRTYAKLRSTAAASTPGYPLLELVEGGTTRATGINFPQRTFITKDGSRSGTPAQFGACRCGDHLPADRFRRRKQS